MPTPETRADAEAELRPLLTEEFFSTAVLAARVIGWSVDLVAVNDFIERCAKIAARERPPIVDEGFQYVEEC